MCARVYSCLCFLVFPKHKYQNLQSTSEVRTFLGSKDIMSGLHNFKSLFEASNVVLTIGLEVFQVNDWVSLNKDRKTRMCVCV